MMIYLQTRLGFVCFGSPGLPGGRGHDWILGSRTDQSVSEEHFRGFLHNLTNRSRTVKRGKLLPEQKGGKEMSNKQKKNLPSTLVKCTGLELNAVESLR